MSEVVTLHVSDNQTNFNIRQFLNIDIIYYIRKAIYTIIIQQLEIDWAKMTSWESSKEKTTAEQEEHKKLLMIPKTAFHKNNTSPKGKNGVGSVMEVFGVKS